MFPTLARRLFQATRPRLNTLHSTAETMAEAAETAASIPSSDPVYKYKLKKVWPPDIKTMTPQQQLRFEKKYKRRVRLATNRPRWDKFVRLAQLFTSTGILVFFIVGMDWEGLLKPPTTTRPTNDVVSFFGYFTPETRKLSIENSRPSIPPPKKE
ncbi:hypothetical protein VTJ04DRAFT_9427 [Mycothermus thermophilus]|uniref:uncharacterized protein n=1 Tax=Humicola insolens TaxID=85995 RepID=UPI0037420A49